MNSSFRYETIFIFVCLFVQETLDYLKAGLYLAHIEIFTFCRLIIAEIPF